MKRFLAFLTSLLIIVTFAFTTPGTRRVHAQPDGKRMFTVQADGQRIFRTQPDGKWTAHAQPAKNAAKYPQYYAFAYEASNGTPGYPNIYVYCYLATQWPSGTTYDAVTCPVSVDITVDNGPLAGASFTFPSGVQEYTIYSVPVTVPEPQIHYDIHTDPYLINGIPTLWNILPIDSV